MKKILLLFFYLFTFYRISAQVACLPDTASYRDSSAGVYPLPYEAQLSPNGGINRAACLGKPYRFVFTVKVADSLTFGGVRLPLDSVRLATSGAMTGLPNGISYKCNPPTCSFQKNTYGCVLLSGTPTAANQLGNYNLVITGTVVVQGFGISETFPGNFAPGSYTLRLVAANSAECPATTHNEEENNLLTNFTLMPNPAHQQLKITYNSLINSDLNIKVIDLMGKVWIAKTESNSQSQQEITIATDLLPNGIYFLQIQKNNKVFAQKFIIQH